MVDWVVVSSSFWETNPTELHLAFTVWTNNVVVDHAGISHNQRPALGTFYRFHERWFIFVLQRLLFGDYTWPLYQSLNLAICEVEAILLLNVHACFLAQLEHVGVIIAASQNCIRHAWRLTCSQLRWHSTLCYFWHVPLRCLIICLLLIVCLYLHLYKSLF